MGVHLLEAVSRELGVAGYTTFDAFLEHDLDAVVLANYYHQHAPFAVRALEAGKHVMSECSACGTLAEGIALVRAVERTGLIYMFAENYPYMVYNQEMRRLFRDGVVGKFLYGEGEYVHPDSAETKLNRSVGWNHWRNWIPATYYCTHSIAPVMFITDTRPVRVSGFVVPHDFEDPSISLACKRSDTAAMLVLQMDNGAIVKSLHGALRGHQNYTRIHGNLGLMENCRTGDKSMLRVRREPFEKREGVPTDTVYLPDFPEHHEQAVRTGHGGGDFFTNYHFAEAIFTNQRPYLDIYRGIDMSICGILAWRSALAGGVPIDVPDFRDEAVRIQYENDNWTADPEIECEDKPASSVLGEIEPNDEAKSLARQVWERQGWRE